MSDIITPFNQIFQEKQTVSKTRLDDFIKEQGEKQIHDLRTSIRRLEATYFILPNSCKRKKTDNFVSSYKSLFKKNSSIRDYDVINLKLLKHGLPKESNILKYIDKQKEKKVKNVLKSAQKISKLKHSSLKKIDSDKFFPKYEKIILSLITKIQNSIPVVVSDESKVNELHSMRKTAKKLRYVLEIDLSGSYQHVIDSMKLFQDLLGEIHDSDITIEFLKKYSKKFPEFKKLIMSEQKIRSETYRKLSSSLSVKTE